MRLRRGVARLLHLSRFNAANGLLASYAPDTGGGWSLVSGDLRVVSNAVQGVTASTELLSNTGFETFTGTEDDGTADNFDSWTENNSTDGKVEATATAQAGSYAVKIVNTSSFPSVYQFPSVTAGKLYTLSFWTRGDGTAGGMYDIRNETGDAAIIGVTSTGVTGATYTQKIMNAAAPTGCTQFRVRFWHGGASSTVYFDTVSLKECHMHTITARADCHFTVKVTTPASGTDAGGLVLRRSGSTMWLVRITPGTAGTDCELVEISNGVPTVRATADVDWAAATAYTLKATCRGTSITVDVDGTQKLSYTSATVGQTNTGFGLWDSIVGNFTFDDAQAERL